MKYTVFDLEPLNGIPVEGEAPIPDIQYCKGWDDYQNMGISVGAWCTLDTDDWTISESSVIVFDVALEYQDMEVWRQNASIQFLECISKGSVFGGFNSRRFDDNLLSANLGEEVKSNFDLLDMVIESAGLKGVKYWEQSDSNSKKHSYNLSAIVETNNNDNNMQKTGGGARSAILWQHGKRQEVNNDGKNDVQSEAFCLKLLLQGRLIDPNTGKLLKA
jgi:hypothetical protein